MSSAALSSANFAVKASISAYMPNSIQSSGSTMEIQVPVASARLRLQVAS